MNDAMFICLSQLCKRLHRQTTLFTPLHTRIDACGKTTQRGIFVGQIKKTTIAALIALSAALPTAGSVKPVLADANDSTPSIQITSGNDAKAGVASDTLTVAVSGMDIVGTTPDVTLAGADGSTRNLTTDTTVADNSTLHVELPMGDSGLGAGTYTLTVSAGGASASATLTIEPYTSASTIQWDGIYTDDSATYVSIPNPSPGQNVTIRLRAYSGNLTKVVLKAYDTAQSKSFDVEMAPTSTFGPYQLWSATVPASNGGTIYYRFDLYDGNDFACLSGDGLHTSDDTNQNFPLPVGAVTLSTTDANPGDTVTASDPVGDFSGSGQSQTTVNFLDQSGNVVATTTGSNASWSSVDFTVPKDVPNGLYTVDLDTTAKDADGVTNVSLDRQVPLLVGPEPAWMQSFYHDSYSSFYRSPFGAVATGTPVTLRLRGPVDLKSALLRLWGANGNGSELDLPMQPLAMSATEIEQATGTPDATQYSWWTVTIPASDVTTAGTMWYQFAGQLASGQTVYYDDNGNQLEGPGQPSFSAGGPSYQLSVYNQGFTTPDWLKHAVIYEIMPDRFYNGDIANDENPKTQKGIYTDAVGQETLGPIQFHQDWNSQPYDPNIPASSDPAIQALRGNGQWNIDFFGGDLKGIQDKLDYLKSLGVNTLYLMPVFEAESNHKYDTADYMKIDPGFGTAQDWLNLAKAAHADGFHILLDGVFEDTGSDSVYFNKFSNMGSLGAWQAYMQNQPNLSPYYSWYEWTNNPANPYNGWWNNDTLPQTDTNNPSFQQFIYGGKDAVAKHWLALGADGWRLDSADNSNYNVTWWSNFRNAVKSIDPNAAIVGEIWNNATNDNGTDWLTGSTFDSVMNYSFRNAVIDFFRGTYNDGSVQHHAVDAAGFNQELMRLYSEYPLQSFYAMMNLVDSQDTMRILTVLENAPEPGSMSALQQATYQPTATDQQLGIKRLELVSDLQFGFPGDPTIWYGDEAGVSGYSDPLSRDTYPWGHENETLLNHYRLLGAIRAANPVLQTGTFTPVYAQGEVYAFARTIQGGQDVFGKPAADASAIVALNNQNQTQTVNLPVAGVIANGTKLLDELNDQWYTVENGAVQLTLAPYEGAILVTPTANPVAYLQTINGQTSIAWTPVAGANGYLLLRHQGDVWVPVGRPLSANTLSSPVTQGATAVDYAIAALPPVAPGVGLSLGQPLQAVTVPAASLGQPQVQVDVQHSGVSLHITPVPNATQYVVYLQQPDGSYQAVATVAAHGDVHLRLPVAPGTQSISVRVAAQNEDGQAVTDPMVITVNPSAKAQR